MTRTFIDAGVLIIAGRGVHELSSAALNLLSDPEREFASSPFVELEVLPKAVYMARAGEIVLYRAFFAKVAHRPGDLAALVPEAQRLAELHGLGALDALHAAAALAVGAEEFVTTEGPTKPIHRVAGLNVITLLANGP